MQIAFPYVALVWGPPHNVKAFVDANQGASTAAAALLIIAAGLVVESVGSYFEYYVIDRRHADPAAMQSRWREYLKIAWTTEPIGQHYLRRILTIFKFELNVLVAIGIAVPGGLLLAYWQVLSLHGLLWAGGITVSLALYLYRASVTSSLLLDSLRQDLIAQARVGGALKSGADVEHV